MTIMARRPIKDCWDWEDKAQSLFARRLWKDALQCFSRSLRRNPCDTVTRELYVSALEGKRDCLLHLGRVRDAASCDEEARSVRKRLRMPRRRRPKAISPRG